MQPLRIKRLRPLQWLAMIFVITCLIAAGYAARVVRAQAPNHATLLVVFGPDDVYSGCITFSESEINGSELLARSGLPIITQAVAGLGVTVCKIDATGCDFPGTACFCQCLGNPCNYWSYWTWRDGFWLYAGRGASTSPVRNGDINAWVWGDGQTQPPAIGAGGACAASGSTQSATLTPVPPQIAQDGSPYPPADSSTSVPPVTSTYPEPATATPEPIITAENTLAADTSATVTATLTSESTPTPAPPSETPTVPKPTATAPTVTNTPDRSASIIAQVATNRAATGIPTVAPEAAEKRSYWAFAGIALLMLLAIAYVLLLRRQRAKGR